MVYLANAPASFTFVKAVTKEYELCLKCHSYYSYGATPPTVGTKKETDQAKEFNPNNPSYHAVIGPSKASGKGTYIKGWTATSPMTCGDCHGSDNPAAPGGPHGSVYSGILKKPFTTTTKYSTLNARCFDCHDRRDYGAGGLSNTAFKSGSTNLHNIGEHKVPCANCHSAVPHGMNRKRLLVLKSDPAPYNAVAKNTGITFPTTANSWKESSCSTVSGCH